MTDDLTTRLRAAADDGGRPLRTDPADLLRQAHRADARRRGVRAGAAVLGAAAVTAAVLVVPAWLESDDPAPAPAGPAASSGGGGPTATDDASPTPSPEAPLSEREVVTRCAPQLEKFYELPMYARERLRVAHDRDYRVGDVVLLHSRRTDEIAPGFVVPSGGNPVLCEIPEAGREEQPVPFERFEVDGDDPARVLELCAEQFVPQMTGGTQDDWVDLRLGEVVSLDRDGSTASALVRVGRQEFACALSPVTWDAGLNGVRPAFRGDIYLDATTTGIKSIVYDAAAYYHGAGRTDPAARSLRLAFADGRTAERPVGPDGAYAVMVRLPGAEGIQDVTVDVLDGRGSVLESFPPL